MISTVMLSKEKPCPSCTVKCEWASVLLSSQQIKMSNRSNDQIEICNGMNQSGMCFAFVRKAKCFFNYNSFEKGYSGVLVLHLKLRDSQEILAALRGKGNTLS